MKSLVAYNLNTPITSLTEEALAQYQFHQCSDNDASRCGFSFTDEGDVFLSVLGGNTLLLRYTTQEKKPHKAEVARRVQAKASLIEEEHGVSPNKNELETIKFEVMAAMLPETPANEPKHFTVVITENKVYVEGGYKQAEEILDTLRRITESIAVTLLNDGESVEEKLTEAVATQLNTDKLVLADACKLLTAEERTITVKRNLFDSEAVDLAAEGAVVKSVQLEFDSVITFTVKEDLSLSGIKFSKDIFSDIEEGDNMGTLLLQVSEVIKLVDSLVEYVTVK